MLIRYSDSLFAGQIDAEAFYYRQVNENMISELLATVRLKYCWYMHCCHYRVHCRTPSVLKFENRSSHLGVETAQRSAALKRDISFGLFVHTRGVFKYLDSNLSSVFECPHSLFRYRRLPTPIASCGPYFLVFIASEKLTLSTHRTVDD